MVALLGDNGAGKSTLIKCISGAHRLDSGKIAMDGRPGRGSTRRRTPARSGSRPSTRTSRCSTTSSLGQLLRRAGGRRAVAGFRARCASSGGATWRKRPASVLGRLEVSLPRLDATVGLMSGGQRQAVAVSRAAAFASNIVILDEPTAALGVRESRSVLNLIHRLRDERQGRDPRSPTRWTT